MEVGGEARGAPRPVKRTAAPRSRLRLLGLLLVATVAVASVVFVMNSASVMSQESPSQLAVGQPEVGLDATAVLGSLQKDQPEQSHTPNSNALYRANPEFAAAMQSRPVAPAAGADGKAPLSFILGAQKCGTTALYGALQEINIFQKMTIGENRDGTIVATNNQPKEAYLHFRGQWIAAHPLPTSTALPETLVGATQARSPRDMRLGIPDRSDILDADWVRDFGRAYRKFCLPKAVVRRGFTRLAIDGSMVGYQVVRHAVVSAAFTKEEMDAARYVFLVRHSADRFNSAFAHLNGDPTLTVDAAAEAAINATYSCIKNCLKSFGEDFSVEDALAGRFDWYACCNGDYLESAAHGFYAQQLRMWYCTMYLSPRGIHCPSWDDPAIEGLMSSANQRRFLILQYRDWLDQPRKTVVAAVEHFQPLSVQKVEKLTRRSVVPGGAVRKRNVHPHTQDLSPRFRSLICQLYMHEEKLLAKLLGWTALPWDLGTEAGCAATVTATS